MFIRDCGFTVSRAMIVKFDIHVLENTCTLNYFSVSILDACMLSGWRWIKSGLTVFDSAGYQIIKLDKDWNWLAQKYNPFLFGQAWSSGLELYLVQWFVWLDYWMCWEMEQRSLRAIVQDEQILKLKSGEILILCFFGYYGPTMKI